MTTLAQWQESPEMVAAWQEFQKTPLFKAMSEVLHMEHPGYKQRDMPAARDLDTSALWGITQGWFQVEALFRKMGEIQEKKKPLGQPDYGLKPGEVEPR